MPTLPPVLPPARQRLVALMAQTVSDQARARHWTYAAVRPESVPPAYQPGMWVRADCSKGCQMLTRWANAPDAMQNGFNAYGNSSTIWLALHHIPLSEAEPGDVVVFGYRYGEKHACMLWEHVNGEWLVWNMGRPGQPAKRRLADEIAAHAGMAMTVCQLPIKDLPPTPQQLLRQRTGFYSWLAWQLGEGPWRHYAPKTLAVRPNVPKMIPLAWWLRRKQFLLNRKRGNTAL